MAKKKVSKKKKATKAMGRPHLFTEGRRQVIYNSLMECPILKLAWQDAGISKQTFYNWFNKGREDYEAGLKTDFAEFFDQVSQLAARGTKSLVRSVMMKSETDWKAAQYLLACIDGKTFGMKSAIKVEDKDTPESESSFSDNLHAKVAELVSKHEGE